MAATMLYTLLFAASCDTAPKEENSEMRDSTATTDSAALSNEMSLYSLPAPMQIPTAIKKLEPSFHEDLLNPANRGSNSTTSFKKTVNLGIYAVDLGYSLVYEQNQMALHYLETVKKLTDELNIGGVSSDLAGRFKNNLSNRDSLTYITLSTFSNLHNQLYTGSRESDALLILTGSFVEGAYLLTALHEKKKDKGLRNMIAEQKIFLDNLMALSWQLKDQDEIKQLVSELEELKKIYDNVEIKYSDLKDHNQIIESIVISNEQVAAITSRIKALRAELVK